MRWPRREDARAPPPRPRQRARTAPFVSLQRSNGVPAPAAARSRRGERGLMRRVLAAVLPEVALTLARRRVPECRDPVAVVVEPQCAGLRQRSSVGAREGRHIRIAATPSHLPSELPTFFAASPSAALPSIDIHREQSALPQYQLSRSIEIYRVCARDSAGVRSGPTGSDSFSGFLSGCSAG